MWLLFFKTLLKNEEGGLTAYGFKNILIELGKNSTEIWFFHAIFFTPNKTFQKIAIFSNNPLVSVLVALVFSFVAVQCIDKIFSVNFFKHKRRITQREQMILDKVHKVSDNIKPELFMEQYLN